MDEYSLVNANGMICETLDPKNKISQQLLK